jgi:predicted CXXCH cytochrome family protein
MKISAHSFVAISTYLVACTILPGDAQQFATGAPPKVIHFKRLEKAANPIALNHFMGSSTNEAHKTPIFMPLIQHPTPHPVYPGIDHSHPSLQVVSNSVEGVIDTCSLICLSCHDGIGASETVIKTVGEWKMPFGFGTYSHPIGIDYATAFSRNSYLNPAHFLPSEIILPEGKVGCESCHQLQSTNPYFLALSNTDSALCFSCHIK